MAEDNKYITLVNPQHDQWWRAKLQWMMDNQPERLRQMQMDELIDYLAKVTNDTNEMAAQAWRQCDGDETMFSMMMEQLRAEVIPMIVDDEETEPMPIEEQIELEQKINDEIDEHLDEDGNFVLKILV